MRKERANKRQSVLEAAEHEFCVHGLDGARTTEIARRAGVTHAMLHYYFDTKRDLFRAVVENRSAQMRRSVASAVDEIDGGIKDMLLSLVDRYFSFFRANPLLPRLMLFEIQQHPEYMQELALVVRSQIAEVLTALQARLDRAFAAGEIEKTDAFTIVYDIMSLTVFTFISGGLISAVNPAVAAGEAFFEMREQEIKTIMLKRLGL